MTLKKLGKFLNENVVLIAGIGLIISVHWSWYKLQQYYVPESERKELPIFRAVKYMHSKIMDGFDSAADTNSTSDKVQETK